MADDCGIMRTVTNSSEAVLPGRKDSPLQLQRVLGGGFAIAAGIGTIIGLGILRTPGEIAAVFSNPFTYVGLWLLVGLFVLMNIAVAAELVGMTERSGGYYVLVRRALGPFPGFLMGWIDWLSFPATIAIKAVVLSDYLAAPRTLYALSLDGYGFGKATRVHTGGNPVFAVLLTWLLTVALILIGGFEYLLNLNALFFVVLYVAVMLGVVILRSKEPDTNRPYRAWGHPYSTLLCILGWLLISGFMAYTAPQSALSAVIMTAVSVPVYFAISKFRSLKVV